MKQRNNWLSAKGLAFLLFAFLGSSAAGTDLLPMLITCNEGAKPWVVINGEECTASKFYGYKNASMGPGDDAFEMALEWANNHYTPLVVVFDNGGAQGNAFVEDLNDYSDWQGERYFAGWMRTLTGSANYNCMFTYFKGGTAAPKACSDAYTFCQKYGAGNSFPIMVCYWKWPDNQTIKHAAYSSLSGVGHIESAVQSFISKNKPPADMYNRARCSVGFAIGDSELKIVPDTAQVYVPLVRTNNADVVGSKYGLEVTYPDTTTTNITFTADTVGEIKLEEVATAGKWADGKSIQLILFNTNQVAVATNHITCVAMPANSAGFPYLPGKTDSLEVGDWSMDVGFIGTSVTNVAEIRTDVAEKKSVKEDAEDALDLAIAAYDAATNALTSALSTSNTNYEAYLLASNALDGAIAAYDDATNALAAALSTSNTNYGAYLLASNALDGAIAAYDGATNALDTALSTSNTTYEAYLAADTVLGGAITDYVDATNALDTALSTSNTTYEAYLAADTVLNDAISAYDGATNALDTALSTSNTTYEAYLAADTALNDAISAYDGATNALDTALSTSNTTYAAYLAADTVLNDAIAAYDGATNALDTALSTSNTTYAAYLAAVNTLNDAIAAYDGATNALDTALSTSNTTYAAYLAAVDALDEAISDYVDATNALTMALSEHGLNSQEYTDAQNAVVTATIKKSTAESNYIIATNAYEVAVGDIPIKQGDVVTKTIEMDTAQGECSGAYDSYTNAVAAVDAALGDVETKTAEMNTKQGDRDGKYDSYTNAVAAVDASLGDVETKTTEMNTAQGDRSGAYDSYTNAVAAVDAALGDVETKTTEMNTAQGDRDGKYDSYTNAVAAVDAALGEVETKTTEMNAAQGDRDGKYDSYTNAVAAVDAALGDVETKTTEMNTAQGDRDGAYDSYTNAVAIVDAAQGDVETKTTEMNTKQGDRDGKYDSYTNAVAAVDAALGDVETKTTEMNTKQGECDDATAVYDNATNVLAVAEADFFVVFSGSFVANDEMGDVVAFFGSDEYREWALSNNVRNIVLDCPEDAASWKGASLFSYATAANGKSGASFISINGLSMDEAQNYSEGMQFAFMMYRADWDTPGAPEVLLVRADGTEAGTLSLYRDGSGYDVKENIARLKELVANAADKTEAMNDYLIGEDLPVFAFGGETNGVGSLSVNDTIDWFKVTGLQAKKAITFDITKDPNAPSISFVLATGDGAEIPMSVTNVWVLTDEQIASDVYVGVGAYADAASAATKFNGKSLFSYTVSAKAAPENPGKIGFTKTNDTVTEGQWEDGKPGKPGTSTEYVFKVARTAGLNGRVRAKVSLDLSEEEYAAIHGRFEWTDQVFEWDDLEAGEKDVVITLKNDDACYDASNIVFKVEITGGDATVETGKGRFTLTLEEEDPATYGSLEISNVLLPMAGDGRLYVRSGETVKLTVSRVGGGNGSAMGTVIAKLAGKSFETNEYEWAAMETGIKTNQFEIPAVTAAKTEVLFSLTSSIGKGKDSVKVFALASDAPGFEANAVEWTGIQYTTTETNLVALGALTGMTLKGLNKVSGTVPAGLKVAIVDGKLVVTGTPTAGVETTATFWVTLTRDSGGTLYSMPVTVTFKSEALADVNPGFTSARSWTGLPLAGDGRLMGLLDLTVRKNGMTSARYRMPGGKTVAFSAPGLAGVDAAGNVSLHAEKSVKSGGVTAVYEFSAVLGADGSLEASITCDGENAVVASLPAGAVSWSKDNTAERFGGNYVAAFPLADPGNAHSNTLCFGATSIRFKCTTTNAWNTGKVIFAGTLPNGKEVRGTATFVPTTNNATSASLPVFATSSSDTFSAMVDLNGAQLAAVEGIVPFWRHNEAGIESLSYENIYDVIGAVWSWADWLKGFGGKFDAKKAFGFSFNLNKMSGIAQGTMRLDVSGSGRQSTLSWKGAALPDAKPSILGAYWYPVSRPYTDAKGIDRKRTVKAGDAVGLTIE